MAIPLILATDISHVSEQMTLTANHILAQSGYYDTVTAYINVTYPNGTQNINLAQMTVSATDKGVFYYNYTPTVAGIYFTSTQFYNGSESIGIGSSTFYVEEPQIAQDENMSGFTTLIAIALIAGLLLVLAFKIDKEYAWMRNILMVFSFILIVGMSATALLHKDSCGLVSVNGTLVKQCVTSPVISSVEWWLFLISVTILSIVIAAIIIGLFIKAVKQFVDSGQKLQ